MARSWSTICAQCKQCAAEKDFIGGGFRADRDHTVHCTSLTLSACVLVMSYVWWRFALVWTRSRENIFSLFMNRIWEWACIKHFSLPVSIYLCAWALILAISSESITIAFIRLVACKWTQTMFLSLTLSPSLFLCSFFAVAEESILSVWYKMSTLTLRIDRKSFCGFFFHIHDSTILRIMFVFASIVIVNSRRVYLYLCAHTLK